MFYELKEYKIAKGYLKDFAEIMKNQIIPFQQQMGMEITGTFFVEEDENLYIWIRKFKDNLQKKELYDKVYGSSYWINTIRPQIKNMILKNKSKNFTLTPTNQKLMKSNS